MKVYSQVNLDKSWLYILYVVLLVSFLFLPLLVFAAYDTALFQSGTEIVANGETLTVVESGAESLTVNSGNFTIDMPFGAGMSITSANRRTFTVSPSSNAESFDCGSSSSVLILKGPPSGSGTITVTVTPASSGNCSAGGGGIASSGGGGGGGYTPPMVTAAATTVATPTVTTPTVTPVAISVAPVFTSTMKKGMSSADIKRLQQLLNSDSDTRIAASGVGSPGKETNYYGSLTEAAVKKFQAKYGLASSGTPETTGYGLVGPATRAKLFTVFSAGVTPVAPSIATPSPVASAVSPVFSTGMSRGMSSTNIKRLQQLLNSDPDTSIAASGVGSVGSETEFFGSLTEKAVQKFQVKYGVASSGDVGYGYVGPKTRAKLQEVFNGTTVPTTPVAPAVPTTPAMPAVPTTSGETAERTALQQSIQDALKQVEELQAQLQTLLSPAVLPPTTHIINMDMMMYEEEGGFSNPAITIKKGDSITWKNMGSMAHTVTSDNGVFDSGNMDTSEMFTYTFNETGEFPYNCTYHIMMGMVGTVVVQ